MNQFSFKITRTTCRVVEMPDAQGWVSEGIVLTPHGIVDTSSNTYVDNGHTTLHFMHAGRLHVRSFKRYYRPAYLVTLADRFAKEISNANP